MLSFAMHIRFPAYDTSWSYPDCIIAGVGNGKETAHKPPFQEKVVSIPKMCLLALVVLTFMNHLPELCEKKGEASRDPVSQMNQKLASSSSGLFASTNMKDTAVQLFLHSPLA